MQRVYLDHSATTPLDARVLKAMTPYFSEKFGNASSIHSFGREAKLALEESREKIAQYIGAEPGEIFFTSGGTEADNHAIKGIAYANYSSGKNHIITSKAEHHAVLDTCVYLAKNGFDVTFLGVDEYGMVDPDDVKRHITSKTCLISLMHGNNEVGTLNPVLEIAKIAKEHDIVFHSDTVQTIGKIRVDVNELGMDLLSIAAHKIYGPKGIGAIFIRKGTKIEKFIHGGKQERNRRAGTENVPLAVGFAKAVEICAMSMQNDEEKFKMLKEQLRDSITERIENIIFNGHPTHSLPNILSLSFDSSRVEVDGELLILNMDLHGVAVSSGSACTAGSIEPSHVLLAMGRDEKTALASIRFSFGRKTTEEEVNYVVGVLEDVARKIVKVT